ncbi:MAG TPA: hemerythrin domain-containing protein [Planctomycetes bacterium]|nr:hemerythrin domain-containing protein [Planctomycetota bacterium]
MVDQEKYAAVADNFIYVHRALRRDLERIIAGGEELFASDFPLFARILEKHSEVEDALFFPALEERSPGSTAATVDQHRKIEDLVAVLASGSSTDTQTDLATLQEFLLAHLAEEEEKVMPAMMEHFEAAEIWALDGRIMEFCSPEFMQEMLPWWFTHIDAADRVCVAQNMTVGVPPEVLPVLCQWIAAGLDETQWNELVGQVPALAATA